MKCIGALAALLAIATVTGEVTTNPLGKVFELMDSLTAKIKAEGDSEGRAYSEYVEWCDDASKADQFEIKSATGKKAELEASIAQATADIEASTSKIEDLAAAIAADDRDKEKATTIRTKENRDFQSAEKELIATVDTLERAIGVIERESAKNPALVQMDASNMKGLVQALSAVIDGASFSSHDKKQLLALVQSRDQDATDATIEQEEAALGAPAAAGYKSHSGGILGVLEELKDKAEVELSELRKGEVKAAHNFDMLEKSLSDSIAANTKSLGDEKNSKASNEGAKGTAEGDLANTNKDLADAKGSLATTQTSCMQAAADQEASMRSRTEELTAIAKAKSILEESSSGAVGQTYSLLQVATQSQLRTRTDLAKVEVLNLVKQLARKYHSSSLAQLADRIKTVMRYGATNGADPFEKVKALIKNLIERLLDEAAAEASEKAFCDEQLAKTAAKAADLEGENAKLSTKIDTAAAKSEQLKEEVKELQGELAALAKLQAEMDKTRMDENAAYTKAKADLEQGLTGVQKALGVLRDYYGSASFVQQPSEPETHGKASGAGGGIIDILEVVESDFAKGLAADETAEGDAAAAYEKLTQENKITTTLKNQDVKYKTQESTALDKEIAELSSDRDTVSRELDAVNEYGSKMKQRCIAKPESFGHRQKRRQAEIDGLKHALSILNSEGALVQRGRAFRR